MPRARRALHAWPEREASASVDPGALLVALCQRLIAVGVPLHGATLTTTTLNPLVAGSTFVWHHDRRGPLEAPRLHGVPCGISPLQPGFAAPHSDDDLLPLDIAFSDGSCQSLILATAPPGFDRAQRARLRRGARRLAAPLEIVLTRQTAATLLTTYLGRRSGGRVLAVHRERQSQPLS